MSKGNFWEGTDAEIILPPQINKNVIASELKHEMHSNSSNFWDGTDAEIIPSPQQTPQKDYSIGNRVASAGKAITAGAVGAIPDTAALAYNIPVVLHNALARHNQNLPDEVKKAYEELVAYNPDYASYLNTTELPTIPSATEAIDKGIDSATGGYTETPEDQKHINEGLKFGASFATGGGIAKTTQGGLAKVGNFMGNLEKSQIAGASAAGATTSYLADQGASVPESIGGGISAQLLTTLGAKKAPKLVGFNKNNIDVKLATATKDLDVPLENSMINKSKAIVISDKFLNRIPIIGNNVEKRNATIATKVVEELDKAYDSIIPKGELLEIEKRISAMHDIARNNIPKDAQVVPNHTLKIINEIRNDTHAPALSGDFSKLNSTINSIQNNFAPSGIKNIPSNIKSLINQKENLGNMIHDGTFKSDKGKFLANQLNNAIKDDIAAYGKTSPEWYQYYTKANELDHKFKNRQRLEKLFGNVIDDSTNALSYKNLSKVIHNKDTKEELKRLVQPEVFDRLEKLGTIARAITIKNKNNKAQSSKFAAVQSTAKIVATITGIGGAGIVAPTVTAATVLASLPIARMLSDRKMLDYTINFATSPTSSNAISFNRRMKAITGYTPVTLLREVQSQEQEKQSKGTTIVIDGSTVGYKVPSEENKQRPKAKALKQILNSPAVKGYDKLIGLPREDYND